MHWTCAKCGKTIEFSDEQLCDTEGAVVCPQCLSSAVVPGYSRPRKGRPAPDTSSGRDKGNQGAVASSTPPARRPRKPSPPPPPPPRRKPISFVDETMPSRPNRQQNTGDTGAPTGRPKKKKRKSSKSKSIFTPHTTMGCLWRSVLYTLVALVLYTALGLLLQCT